MKNLSEQNAHGYTEGSEYMLNGQGHESYDQDYMDGQKDMEVDKPCLIMALAIAITAIGLICLLGYLWFNGTI